MMKITLFILATLALVCALPQDAQPAQAAQPAVEIVKQDSDVNVDGYHFDFETSDGTVREEQGDFKNDTDQQGLLVRGSYKYVAPDGSQIQVTYVADKNGYQPTVDNGTQAAAAAPAPAAQA